MSGGLLTPVTPSDPLPDPRTCFICREKYQDVRMLQCCHSFCARCLQDRVMDMALLCPLCGSLTKLEGPLQMPPVDPVVKFLVETVHDDKPLCANCDQWADAMFYCNTCAQPLCGECRQATHSAKMFHAHQIGPMMPRTRETFKTCDMHGEPFILFSVENKSMLCINCFRDLNVESRPYCIDLDMAYSQSCQLLDQSAQTVKEVQRHVNDGILLLKSLLQELKQNAEQERVAILTLYSDITEKIAAKRDDLLQDVERQSDSKHRQFSDHLRQLNCLLPTVQTQLQMTSEFSSTANKFEFLELAYRLMERINHTLHSNPELQPSTDGSIQTNYRSQFARSLDSLLSLKPVNRYGDHSPSLSPASLQSHPDYKRGDTVESTLPSPSATSTITFTSDGGRKINGSSGVNKVIMIESKGIFANHFKELENKHRDIVQRFEAVKGCVQELQRDMTMRRCLAKTTKVTELLDNTSVMEDHITKHLETAEKQRPSLERHWEDIFHQVSDEQEVYQAQVNDILRMRQEAQHLNTIIKKLAPFVKSINNVTERLSPRLGEMTRENEKGDQIQALFERISTLDPDSQLRVDAIRSTEEERQQQSANRVNPLDDELIRTKEKLKSPSIRIEREEQARQAKVKQENSEGGEDRNRTESETSIVDDIKDINGNEKDIDQSVELCDVKDDREIDCVEKKDQETIYSVETLDILLAANENEESKNAKTAEPSSVKDIASDTETRDPSSVEDIKVNVVEICVTCDEVIHGTDNDPVKDYNESSSFEAVKDRLENPQESDVQNDIDNQTDSVCETSAAIEKDNCSAAKPEESFGSDGVLCTEDSSQTDIVNAAVQFTSSGGEICASNDGEICASNDGEIINAEETTSNVNGPDVPREKVSSQQTLPPTPSGHSSTRRKKGVMRELRKCNSLGRGKEEKSESKPPTGRKYSFDFTGVSPNDLNLRTLLHDAIIARGEQKKDN